jgi:sigma-B regulation protein RsbQ
MDILKRNNVNIYGHGLKYLMLAHGFGCDQHVWRHFIKAFENEYKIIVFDYVGAGNSDLSAYNSKRYGVIDGYADDVIEILDALQLRQVVFVGHSVSSMIGVRSAIRRPELFSALILMAPSPSYINETDYVGGMDKESVDGLLKAMESNYLGWAGSIAPAVMGNPETPELGLELTSNFCATDPEIAKEFARVTFLTDNREDLKKLHVESLTLQCSEDILAPLEVGYYIRENTANNTLVVLKATGHCPHLSAPEETIDAIKTYLYR